MGSGEQKKVRQTRSKGKKPDSLSLASKRTERES